MKKRIYLDAMEAVMSAYSDEHIRSYTASVQKDGIKEHGYPRLVANLGFLVANGRRTGYKDEFCRMMDLCCREIPVAYGKNGWIAGNDFSVKEIVICLLEIEKSGIFDKSVTDNWRRELSCINPYETYSIIAGVTPGHIHNWAAFGAASEQLRSFAGIGNEAEFVERQVESQLLCFDCNGMYRDPNEPMVYDFVTRLQLAAVLWFGYDGALAGEIEDMLIKSADITLKMQSVTGEIPFGGRSAQFLHNETMFAALCEFYASFFGKKGDLGRAGRFKSAAALAIANTHAWLDTEYKVHVKNYFPRDSMFGCEVYAYFDKYMITTASWLCLAYTMADDSIGETDCPAITDNGICCTSEHFHKVICHYGDYFVQIDTKADPDYDASGIGRIHKRGVPSALCLSVPFCREPHYETDIKNPSALAICAGIKSGDGYVYACDEGSAYTLTKKDESKDSVSVSFECAMAGGARVCQMCTVSDDGVEIRAEGDGEVAVLFAVLDSDGKTKTKTDITKKSATVTYGKNSCTYTTDGVVDTDGKIYANRNGHYRSLAAKGVGSVCLKIQMH